MRPFTRFSTLTLALVGVTSLMAQETVGTLVGSITDQKTGKPLQGVRLILRSPKILSDRTVISDADGNYRIPLLPNGEYALSCSKDGYVSGTVKCFVSPGQTIRQNMRVAPIQTEVQGAVVQVIAAASQIDKTETSTQSVYSMDTLTALLPASDLLSITSIAPGVVTDGNDQGTTVHIRGGNTVGGKFLVNGMSAGDAGWGNFKGNQLMVTDMIESVSLIQSPLNARYGNTESGMISYVTTRGTNEFKGSVRANYGRSTLGATGDPGYPGRQVARFGSDWNTHQISPTDDAIDRSYEATLSGPLWKDHITFAWGGRFKPTKSSQNFVPRWWSDYNGGSSSISHDYANSTDGTLFVTPGGAQIRKANLWDQGKTYKTSQEDTFNQYSVFYQITQDQTLEWSYSQARSALTDMYNRDWNASISSGLYGNTGEANRVWNLGYKGVFGTHLVEARLARHTSETIVPPSSGYLITSGSNRTWENGNYSNGASSIPGAFLHPGSASAPGAWYPYTNLLEARKRQGWTRDEAVAGSPYDQGDKKSNTTFYVNVQSLLGDHQIDWGLNYERTDWDTSTGAAPRQFYTPGGQISPDLTATDILYPTGYTGALLDPSAYAGKWVMWAAHANLTSLWPGTTDAVSASRPYAYQWYGGASMRNFMGPESGSFNQPTTSLYVNDRWTLNSNFSVMGGLRFDRFQLGDDKGSVLAYNILTPRFEFKWDLGGDQKRLLSYSFGRFHNRIPAAMYMAFVHRRKPYIANYSWDPTTNGLPYDGSNLANNGFTLASTQELLNPANYTYFRSLWSPDFIKLDPNFKAEYSDEHSISFRRAYDNGSNIRFTLVRRDWKNNYQWLADPYQYSVNNAYTNGTTVTSYRNLLANDPGLYHDYTAAEIEWDFKLSPRLTFGGNYNYSRNHQNLQYWSAQSNLRVDNIGTNHWVWGLRWEDLWKRFGYSTEDITEPSLTINQVTNFWLTYDLSHGAVKSSLVLRGKYTAGSTWTQQEQWDLNPYSAEYQAVMAHAPANYATTNMINGGAGTYIFKAQRGTSVGGFQYPDAFELNLRYNLEIPIGPLVRWWMGVEVSNPFNHVYTQNQVGNNDATLHMGQNLADGSQATNFYGKNGYFMDPSTMQYRGPYYAGMPGGRYFTVETGIKF
ncbi:TonB-dependent receptor [Geothrix sp. PMB-07]|uniref:TonB-dependent receptor n=1 Tax=Geothrix sp. PMB-07 TaxID=3068640 RepID=UPI002740F6F3|nr:TonB-dependent receptor [Geothrix sp. PMB-07]WLT30951.1 TonB-dependent receptor [Geothrix sp. PMB-07]